MLVTLLTNLAGAATAILALASGRNMLQTYRIVGRRRGAVVVPGATDVPPSMINTTTSLFHKDILSTLPTLSRRELLELYLACEDPVAQDLSRLQGVWHAQLLSNNVVLTAVSAFITHQLFGGGQRWAAKIFDKGGLTGINGFCRSTKKDKESTPVLQHRHAFDVSVQPSRLRPDLQSIQLRYHRRRCPKITTTHHLSFLWTTMVDELRIVPVPKDNDEEDASVEVLLGLGSLAWSGGVWNASPFVLWRNKTSIA